MNQTAFRLYANCIAVKGHAESLIQDIQRNNFLPIPNLLFNILEENQNHLSIDALKTFYEGEYDEGIDAYFEYLDEHELGFFTNEPENFPALNKTFSNPFQVITASVEIENTDLYDFLDAINQINNLGCPMLDIRFTNEAKDIKPILFAINNYLNSSRYKIVNLYIPTETYVKEYSYYMLHKHSCINTITIFGCLQDGIEDPRYDNKTIEGKLRFVKKVINSHSKDVIDLEHFVNNEQFFVESYQHNAGLNRKVSVDKLGNIKSNLSHTKIYGNLKKDQVNKVIQMPDFQKKWHISNDKIEKCKDCQYRYMCMSNTDIIEDKNGKFNKVDLCTFDPYLNEWEE
jgi:SPASM domain peptide maturase of grasp-with-spasm system